MYSVIIQNQKTIEEFTEFHPLYLEALNKDLVGVCKWNESGTTIDTALPDLSYLIDDKETWRAIIICMEGDGTGGEKSDENNPFDFEKIGSADSADGNSGRYIKVEESHIPLVRLTQMIGGVPEPEIDFQPEEIHENEKAPRIVYTPIVNEEDSLEYERLTKKYKLNGKPPESVIIIKVRSDYQQEILSSKVWRTHKESESSDFCRRNRYPSKCRFLVYDYLSRGNNQLEYDKFCFWNAVLIVALNKIDSSTLQAYRLYSLKIVLNKSLLEENFQNSVKRLKSVSNMINQELKRQKEKSSNVNPDLPDFELSIDVPVENVDADRICVKPKEFGLFSEGTLSEDARWISAKERVTRDFEKAVKTAERTLDIKADQARLMCRCTQDDVIGLDKFQREDLIKRVDDLYGSIIKIQGELPDTLSSSEKVNQKSRAVRDNLKKRFSAKSALMTCIITLVALTFGFASVLLDMTTNIVPRLSDLLIPIAAGIGLSVVLSLLVTVFQKHKLNNLIKEFNGLVRNSIARLNASTGTYSDYLSSVASHIRGSTYLVESEKIDFYEESSRSKKMKHLRAIGAFITKIRIWAKAFGISTVEMIETVDYIEVNLETKPAENSLYTFDYDESYPVELNESGRFVNSPFSFVSKIRIEREELYEDD